MDQFPKVSPVSPGSSKFLTLPPSHSLILFGKLPLESPPAHPTNTTSSRFFLQQLRTGNKLKKPSTFRSGTTQTTSFPASFPKNLIYECCTEFWPFTNQSKPEEQLGFSFLFIPNPATLCALEIFPSFPWHMLMLMAPPGTDFPASNPPPPFLHTPWNVAILRKTHSKVISQTETTQPC